MSVERFNCTDCGVGVRADEDGCCAHCGADCEIVAVEATPQKNEHEWTAGGQRFRIVYETGWNPTRWFLEYWNGERRRWEAVLGQSHFANAEIARLAGLVRPEGA